MSNPNRVLFFIPTMEVGGAEQVCLNYLNHLRTLERFLLLQIRKGPLLHKLDPDVTVLEIRQGESSNSEGLGRWNHLKLVRMMRLLGNAQRVASLARQYQCSLVASFITAANIITILAKVFFYRRLKVVINVHDVTSRILEHTTLSRSSRFVLRQLIRFLYPRADAIVAVAHGIKRDLIESFGVPAQKIVVIYNPIDVQGVRLRAVESVAHPWFVDRSEPVILAVGRLVKLKGFDLLIRAFAQLSMKAKLVIIGEGEERSSLEHLIIDLGLTDRVALLGFQENPWKYMARADLFVLSSLTEGMPNVVGEAMALGLPIVATDCSPGVREYLDEGRAGLLVPPSDPRALASGLERLLSDELLRKELAQKGRERIAQFELATAVGAYEKLLESLTRNA